MDSQEVLDMIYVNRGFAMSAIAESDMISTKAVNARILLMLTFIAEKSVEIEESTKPDPL